MMIWYDGEPTYWDLELDWLISLLTFMIKNCQSGLSTYLIGDWIGLFLWSHLMSEQWYDGEPTYWDLELDWLISLFISMIKNVQNGITNNYVLDWKLDLVISVLISVILYIYVNSDRMVTLWVWIGIWNCFTIIWGNAYVLEFDNATSMYWIWNWIRSYLLIFQGIYMFKNFEGVISMYWIWNWIGSYLRSCKCLNMVHPCICLNIVHPCIVT